MVNSYWLDLFSQAANTHRGSKKRIWPINSSWCQSILSHQVTGWVTIVVPTCHPQYPKSVKRKQFLQIVCPNK